MMQVYAQQRRFDHMRSLRLLARTLTIVALVILGAATVVLDRRPPSAPLVRARIGAGFAVWLITFALDYQVHSHRLNSRMIMMRRISAQADISEIALSEPHYSSPRAGSGVGPVITRSIEQLQGEVSRLETTLDQSERQVERALLASSIAALIGMLAIILGVALSFYLAR